ncbi:MAG: tRNA (adenosine(37)-N6)-threonylcarbamoyltransferase complex dimerization subunit type 1 TsaB [Pirellulales bacterium]
MRILALETSGLGGSVALLDDASGFAMSRELAPGRRSAQGLAPAIQQILADARWSLDRVANVAVTTGPGSFTGLRIGVTTAKTLAYALGASIVSLNSLDVLADAVSPSDARLWALLDAHRGELFAASYRRDAAGTWQREDATRECSLPTVDAWLTQLAPGDMVTGPIVSRLAAKLPDGVSAVAEELRQPQARHVAQLASRRLARGERDDVWNLVPYYGRLSAAEEKRLAGG